MATETVEYCDVCDERIVTTTSRRTGRTRKGEGTMAFTPSLRRRIIAMFLGPKFRHHIVGRNAYRDAHLCNDCRENVEEILAGNYPE